MLLESIKDTNEIYGLEMFAMVAGVVALGEQLRGKRVMLFSGRQRGSRSPDKSVVKNPDDFSSRRKFLGMLGATVSGMLGGEGCFRCKSGRCPRRKRTIV